MPARILVIDDTLSLVDLIHDILGAEGFAVSTCLIASGAYELAREIQPDLVILDIVKPEVSGWDILEQLRGDIRLRDIPIVICTAWAEQAAGRMRELRQPGLWLLPKPFDAQELLDTVQEALDLASG